MLTSERKAMISARLRQDGRIVAKTLAEELGLSEDTIRRDLREMAADGLLTRVHGGALPREPTLADYDARTRLLTEEKRLLAQAAVTIVQPGDFIFIDGGSTNLELARALPRHFPFTVATHSPTIASAFEHHSQAEIMLVGGKIYRHSMVATGAMALEAISRIRVDLFFLGVTGIHPLYGLTTGDMEEATIKRAIAGQARETWVLATTEKLDAASPVTILPLTQLTGVFVRDGISSAQAAMFTDAGVQLLGVRPAGAAS